MATIFSTSGFMAISSGIAMQAGTSASMMPLEMYSFSTDCSQSVFQDSYSAEVQTTPFADNSYAAVYEDVQTQTLLQPNFLSARTESRFLNDGREFVGTGTFNLNIPTEADFETVKAYEPEQFTVLQNKDHNDGANNADVKKSDNTSGQKKLEKEVSEIADSDLEVRNAASYGVKRDKVATSVAADSEEKNNGGDLIGSRSNDSANYVYSGNRAGVITEMFLNAMRSTELQLALPYVDFVYRVEEIHNAVAKAVRSETQTYIIVPVSSPSIEMVRDVVMSGTFGSSSKVFSNALRNAPVSKVDARENLLGKVELTSGKAKLPVAEGSNLFFPVAVSEKIVEREIKKVLLKHDANKLPQTGWHRLSNDEVVAVKISDGRTFVAGYSKNNATYEFTGAAEVSTRALPFIVGERAINSDRDNFSARVGYAIAMPGGESAYKQAYKPAHETHNVKVARSVLHFISNISGDVSAEELASAINRSLLVDGPMPADELWKAAEAKEVLGHALVTATSLVDPIDELGARSYSDISIEAANMLRISPKSFEELEANMDISVLPLQLESALGEKYHSSERMSAVVDAVKDELSILSRRNHIKYAQEYLNAEQDIQWLAVALMRSAGDEGAERITAKFASEISKEMGNHYAGKLLGLIYYNSEYAGVTKNDGAISSRLTRAQFVKILDALAEIGRMDLTSHTGFRSLLPMADNRLMNELLVEINFQRAINTVRSIDVTVASPEEFWGAVDSTGQEELLMQSALERMAESYH